MAKKLLKTAKQSFSKKVSAARKAATSRLKNKEPAYLSALAIIVLTAVLSPLLHSAYIRSSVGPKVLMVRTSPKGGGGTGFIIKAPSGNNYLMTNDHVCAASKDGLTMVVMNDNGEWIPRKILQRSDKTDLCLLESMPGISGLELAGTPSIGQSVTVVGHPGLLPLTFTEGQLLGTQDIVTLDFITLDKEDPNCKKSKNSIIQVGEKLTISPTGVSVAPVYACVNTTKDALLTSAVIRPGSSGSPMVNWKGQVQGVMFAGDPYGWGVAVSLKDITEMLKLY